LDGELEVQVGDEDFAAGPGDFVFLPEGVPHALTAISTSAPTLLAIATPNARSGGVWPVRSVTSGAWSAPGRRGRRGTIWPAESGSAAGPTRDLPGWAPWG
jgi:hypothetical protein